MALVDERPASASRRPIDATASIAPPAGTGELFESRMPPRPRAAFTDSEETRWASPGARSRNQPPQASYPKATGSGRREETEPGTDPDLMESVSTTGARGKNRVRARRQTRPEDRLGKTLGSYRLVEVIGKGGMGSVYRAEHIKLGREVALKLLRADYAERRDSVARFFQEARAVNRIRHRNIVDVTDFVELEDGTTFIIMELLEGEPMSRLMAAGALDTPRILAILIQICDGLAAAHQVGIVHRDMKPDNVLIVPTDDGADQVKLLDFGVAKLLTREDEDVGLETVAGSVIGTPAYLSPEQAGGLEVDGRADLYSVGAIMYEMYVGQPPFRGKSFGEFVRKHLSEVPTAPHQTARGKTIDPRIEAVILKCLEKQPADRYPDAEALRDELLGLLGVIETQTGRTDGPPEWAPAMASKGHALPLTGGAHTPTPLPPPAPFLSASMPAMQVPVSGMGMGTGEAAAMAPAPAWPQTGIRPPSRKRKWLVAAGALVIAGGLTVSIVATHESPESAPERAVEDTAGASGPVVTAIGASEDAVSVKIISTPSGADVFAFRARDPMSVTPCQLTVDPADGGPEVRRYVIQKDGFQAAEVAVDLGQHKSEYRFEVDLLRHGREPGEDKPAPALPSDEPAQAVPSESPQAVPSESPQAVPSESPQAVPSEQATSSDSDETAPKPGAGDDTAPEGDQDSANRKRHRRHHHADPSDPDKSGGKIAPSDTLNPFGT
ncbi:MAG TPA: protein kinase [Kofleriaceae bacterium]|nr:protein kinase [Kofleriaceae bacterium]